MEALKAENETLKQQIAEAQAQANAVKSESETKFKALEKEIFTFKAQLKSDVDGFKKDVNEQGEPEVRKAFK